MKRRTVSEVLCRPALPSDREAVMDFLPLLSSEDYVPAVWDRWMEADGGVLAAAVLEGRVVGVSHLGDLGGGEWWLEGLRVDPNLHGRHVGSRLHDYQVGEWLRTGGEVVRLATRGSRTAVHRMCQRTEFHKAAEVIDYRFAPLDGVHGFRRASAEEADAATQRLASSTWQKALAGLMDLGWRFARIDPRRIGSLAQEGRLWEWREGEGFLAAWVEAGAESPALGLAAFCAPEGGLRDILRDARRLAGSLGLAGGLYLAPSQGVDPSELAAAGYSPEGSDSLWIFERRR